MAPGTPDPRALARLRRSSRILLIIGFLLLVLGIVVLVTGRIAGLFLIVLSLLDLAMGWQAMRRASAFSRQ